MRVLVLVAALGFTFAASTAQAAGKSAKKIEADRSTLKAPQVIEPGDTMLGVRVANGAAFDDATVLGLNLEHMVRPNFGLGLQAHFAEYDVKYSAGGLNGKYETDAITVVGLGNFHVDMFRVKNLDTYFSGGVAYSTIRGEFKADRKNAFGADDVVNTKSNPTRAVAYFNARYFIDSTWSFTVAAGTGLGNFALGMDMLF